MKRIFALMISVASIIYMCGCGANEQNRYMTDDGRKIVTVLAEECFRHHIEVIIENSSDILSGIEVEIEYLPASNPERETSLHRIKTEIMAGAGPDVFVITTGLQNGVGSGENQFFLKEEAFLGDVKKSMGTGIFLPIDKYLSGEYLIYEEHVDVLMLSGRTDKGQEVLPLTFEYEVFLFNRNRVNLLSDEIITFEDLENSKDTVINNFIGMQVSSWGANVFTNIVDYRNGNLFLTEEEFANVIYRINAVGDRYTEEYTSVEDAPGEQLPLEYHFLSEWGKDFDNWVGLCIPNLDGGITANVTSYVAVNGNCVNRIESVLFAELFFYKNSPKVDDRVDGLGLNTFTHPMSALSGTEIEDFLLSSSERINVVTYSNDVSSIISDLLFDLSWESPERHDELISSAYRKIRMISAE